MKKNLMIAMILLSVVLVSFVISASVTGYLVRGGAVATDGVTATLTGVRDGVATVEVTIPTGDIQVITVPEDKPVQVGDVQISAFDLREGTLFRRPGANVEINVVPPVPVSVTTDTEEICEDKCQTFTEVYKLEEGQQISISGDTISISFISATQVRLMVNGQATNLLAKDQIFELSNGQRVVVNRVNKLEVGGTIGKVELGVLSSYKLEEGQQISIAGDQISIDFISATQVILSVNGQLTALLNKDNTFQLTNGQMVVVNGVHKLEVGGTIGWVELDPSSCYFIF